MKGSNDITGHVIIKGRGLVDPLGLVLINDAPLAITEGADLAAGVTANAFG
jgi:hypothetical protein